MNDQPIPNLVLRSSPQRSDVRPGALDASVAGDVSSNAGALADLPRVLLLGPARTAVSGVSTHLNQLFDSTLTGHFHLSQFQVGSEGRTEGRAGTLVRMITSPFAFAACLIRSRPRIVHINTSFDSKAYWRDLVYLGMAKGLRRKVVYQVHGGALPGEFFAGSRVLTALLRRLLSWPDAVVLLAQGEIVGYREFAPRARLVRIANAVSIYDTDLRAERYSAKRPLQIVYLGRLAANKGIFETIEAVRILRDRGVAVQLTLAGSGTALGDARQAIEAAGLGDRVRVIAPVFGIEKQRLWEESDVFAFPTYHREGLPYALLEAMASGAVPVVSPAGAIPDVMQHEVHGLFVPPHNPNAVADALGRLASDRTLLHRMALAGRERIVDQYSVARLAAQFKDVYAGLVHQ
jgi:glycosyltransferase involved in cell wall biosynthesis